MSKPWKRVCRTCGNFFYWATTENGKKMPVDCHPVSDGNIIMTWNPATEELKAKVVGDDEMHKIESGRNRYVSHFATCSNPAAHRK